MIVNALVGISLTTVFAFAYFQDRTRISTPWFVAAFLFPLTNPVIEFIIPFLDDTRLARFLIFAGFLAGLACLAVGLSLQYRLRVARRLIISILVLSFILNLFILEWPRNSIERMALYQLPYFIMMLLSAALVFQVWRVGRLEKFLFVALVIAALQFMSRPVIAFLTGGMGGKAQEFLNTQYAVVTLVVFAVVLLSVAGLLQMVVIRDMLEAHRQASMTDPLSGALNRRGLEDAAERLTEMARRTSSDLTVVMCDIDHFKVINDKLGHSAGDKVIVSLSRLLRESVRGTDRVARVGGEEFCVLLWASDARDANAWAERVRKTFMKRDMGFGGSETPTVSMGIAAYNPAASHENAIFEAMGRADRALYMAKQKGRNQTVVHGEFLRPSEELLTRWQNREAFGTKF